MLLLTLHPLSVCRSRGLGTSSLPHVEPGAQPTESHQPRPDGRRRLGDADCGAPATPNPERDPGSQQRLPSTTQRSNNSKIKAGVRLTLPAPHMYLMSSETWIGELRTHCPSRRAQPSDHQVACATFPLRLQLGRDKFVERSRRATRLHSARWPSKKIVTRVLSRAYHTPHDDPDRRACVLLPATISPRPPPV